MPSPDSEPYTESELVACPRCDALQNAAPPQAGGRTRCVRCGTVLIAPQRLAIVHVLALSVSVLVLMVGVLFLPFLSISARGLSNSTSVLDAALAFAGGPMAPLAFSVLAVIVLIPAARAALILYSLAPVAAGRAPLPGARFAFALEEDLKPWAMAEIFVIGTSVALVKIADLANVHLGAAFWLLGGLVIASVLQDNAIDRWTVWRALDHARGGGRRPAGTMPQAERA